MIIFKEFQLAVENQTCLVLIVAKLKISLSNRWFALVKS